MPDLSRKFCAMPFRRIDLLQNGDVTVCCSQWVTEPVGNIYSGDGLEPIWNGERVQAFRRAIHDGTFAFCRRDRCPSIREGRLDDRDAVTDPELRAILADRRVVLDQGPSQVVLAHDVTCNLSCPSCRDQVLAADPATQARLEVVRRTIIEPILTGDQPVNVVISGQGDPWSSPHYRSILRFLADRDCRPLTLLLRTNANLMTEARWEEVKDLERYHPDVDVSIDAASADTYHRLRRGGNWDRLQQNLRFLSTLRREDRIGQFKLNMTVQVDNYPEMPALVELGTALGCDEVAFRRIQDTGAHIHDLYDDHNVCNPAHPHHEALLDVLRNPAFRAPICRIVDLLSLWRSANSPS